MRQPPASRQTAGNTKAASMPKRTLRYPASMGMGTTMRLVPRDMSPKADAWLLLVATSRTAAVVALATV